MSSAGDQPKPDSPAKLPHGLVSLWDMLNFHLNELVHVLWLLENNRILPAGQKLSSYSAPLEDQGVISRFEIDGMDQIIAEASKVANALDLRSTKQRLGLLKMKLRFNMTNADCLMEIKVLQESIRSDLVECHFYHYPRAKLEFLMGFYPRWNPIAEKFPLVKAEALAATDCYALGHDTASIFQTMRVAEHGLRALAKERQVTLPRDKHIDWGQWQEIIKELNDEIKVIGQKPAGTPKDNALSFYSGAVADLNAFKDEYRNQVMHVRKAYDQHQALRALGQVHAFMQRISEKIDHRHHRIRWGFKKP